MPRKKDQQKPEEPKKKRGGRKRAAAPSSVAKNQPAEKPTPEEAAQAEFEKKNELAQYMGYKAFRKALKVQDKIRAVGIIGALMRGDKRYQVRKAYHISPNKMNRMLDSEVVDDVMAFALHSLFSMQTAAVNAILHQLRKEHNGKLALEMLDRLGAFDPNRMTRIFGVSENAKEESPEGRFIKLLEGNSVAARQFTEKIESLAKDFFRNTKD